MKKVMMLFFLLIPFFLASCQHVAISNEEASKYFSINAHAEIYSISETEGNKANLKIIILPKENTYYFIDSEIFLSVKYQAGIALKSLDVKVSLNKDGSGALVDKLIDIATLTSAADIQFEITIQKVTGTIRKK